MRQDRRARLWGGFISLLICVQLLALDVMTRLAIKQMLRQLAMPPSFWTAVVHVAADMILLVSLWLYYDSIDDRGFAAFCQSENRRPLWDIPAHGAGLTVAVAAASPVLCFPLYELLTAASLHRVVAAILASVGAVGFTVAGRVALLVRLRSTWAIQRELVNGKEKRHRPVSRVLYASVFFLSLGLAIWVGLAFFAPQIIKLAGLIPDLSPWLIGAVLALLSADHATRLTMAALSRRRFLSRLGQLAERGQITYTVEGHPYLSLLSSYFYAGVTVHHRTSVSNLSQRNTYRLGLVNGRRRKSIIILCQNQVYRFLHRLPAQPLIPRMGAQGRMLYKPMFAWFEDHAFDFPEGEGERVFLAEPFPAVIAAQSEEADWFAELGLGSHAFGYTVHSPNSFLHMLEA